MATRENTKQPTSSSSGRESSSRDGFKADRNANSSSSRSTGTGSSSNVKKGTDNLNSSRKSGSSMMEDEEE